MIPRNPEFERPEPQLTVRIDVPCCPKCQRTDCGLLATVIIGEREWFKSVAECMEWQARIAALPKGKALAVMGHEQYRALSEAGLA